MTNHPCVEREDNDPHLQSVEEARALRYTDPKRSLEALQSLADQGSVVAMNYLAQDYQFGRGVPMNMEHAITMYHRAENEGSLDAIRYLAALYGMRGDFSKAQETLERGKARGSRRCCDRLEELERTMRERSEWPLLQAAFATRATDASQGFRELQSLADKGVTQAMLYLGEAYRKGKGTSVDQVQAAHWYERAYQEGGCTTKARAAYQLGWLYREMGEFHRAYEAYQCGADYGNVPCLRLLGNMRRKGLGCEKDLEKARAYFEAGADIGNVFAAADLARLLMLGHWGWRSRIAGLFLHWQAAKNAVSIALRNPKDHRLQQ